MKTVKEVLDMCEAFKFYDIYDTEKVMELNYVRDCVISVFYKCGFLEEDKSIRVLVVKDDISIMILDGKDENISVEKIFSSRIAAVVFRKRMCKSKKYENMTVDTLNGKKTQEY